MGYKQPAVGRIGSRSTKRYRWTPGSHRLDLILLSTTHDDALALSNANLRRTAHSQSAVGCVGRSTNSASELSTLLCTISNLVKRGDANWGHINPYVTIPVLLCML